MATWLVESDGALCSRRAHPGVANGTDRITLSLHRLNKEGAELIEQRRYAAGRCSPRQRMDLFFELVHNHVRRSDLLIIGEVFALAELVRDLDYYGVDFIAKIARQARLSPLPWRGKERGNLKLNSAQDWLKLANWKQIFASPPENAASELYSATTLGPVEVGAISDLQLFAVAAGGITSYERAVEFAVTNIRAASLKELVNLYGWVRWIRPIARRSAKESREEGECAKTPLQSVLGKAALQNSHADEALASLIPTPNSEEEWKEAVKCAKAAAAARSNNLGGGKRKLNVLELFAGAGGLGVGLLMSNTSERQFVLKFSAEAHPIYVNTLRRNYGFLASDRSRLFNSGQDPASIQPIDLRDPYCKRQVKEAAIGGIDILVGGPPCQGFSTANRSSNFASNPNNQLVLTFLEYVKELRPPVVVFENVRGILWAQRTGSPKKLNSVVEYLTHMLRRLGYDAYPRVLDAAWYGVPQHRDRLFLVAIHESLGYSPDDFCGWGPFPIPTHGTLRKPFVTVSDAIRDLPRIGNGAEEEELEYRPPPADDRNDFLSLMRSRAPRGVIYDHVTSKHADYVLERYRNIPQGGNWRSIADQMTNYADISRTHSNIYRRLPWGHPSITISHYRKAMIIHPAQDRGLSLREASRLQSFPDWFRFAGSEEVAQGGLMHKQQQLANAVCPLVARALGSFLAEL